MNASRPTPITLPGPDIVFDELMSQRTTGAAALVSEASRLYSASATLGIDQPEWASLSAGTVRMWVAVAREARRIHGRMS